MSEPGTLSLMDLETVVQDIAEVLKGIDSSRVPFKSFRPGVGPYGEPQRMKLVAEGLNKLPRYGGCAKTMRTPGNTSLLGDCLKLQAMTCSEQKAVIAMGYEHDPAQVSLEPLWKAFEVVATAVLNIKLGARTEAIRDGLVHPIHQRVGGRGLGSRLGNRAAALFATRPIR